MKLQRHINKPAVFALILVTCVSIFACKSFNKGKDIRVTMEVCLDDFLREKSNDPNDSVLNAAIKKAKIAWMRDDSSLITLFGAIIQRDNPGISLAKLFVKPTQNEIGMSSDNEAVIKALNLQANDAILQTCKILESRFSMIDKDHPKMELNKRNGLIKADFKGDYSQERLNSFVRSRGELLFLETYKNEMFSSFLMTFNDKLAALDSAGMTQSHKEVKKEKGKAATADTNSLNQYVAETNEDKQAAFARKNPLFNVLMPNIDPKEGTFISGPVVGYVHKSDIPKLEKMLADKRMKDILPANAKLVYGTDDKPKKAPPTDILPVYATRYPTDGTPVMDGTYITKARADFDAMTGEPDVTVDMSPAGSRRWKQLTTKNVGCFIALVYDNRVFSCPRVDAPIESTSTQVVGSFTKEEASDMARTLMSGKLPIGVRIVETNVSGNEKLGGLKSFKSLQ